MEEHSQRLAAVALSLMRGVGSGGFRDLVARHGSAAAALAEAANATERSASMESAERVLTDAERIRARVFVLGEADYPALLLDLPDPPPVLFALGRVDALDPPAVAIVGTRGPTPSGERIAWRLAGAVASAGACLVSGMARGIDAAAHRGALDAGGTTVAVLGGGVDVPYPVTHRTLYESIIDTGLVVSEAVPGARPHAGAFPRRNRIIAALSRAVLVIEAGEKSGALHTANHAVEVGRALGAVPGPIDAPQCVGSNGLLRDGATFVAGPADLLLMAGLSSAKANQSRLGDALHGRVTSKGTSAAHSSGTISAAGLTDPREASIVAALRAGAGSVSELAHRTRLPSRELTSALTGLELSGVIWTDHAGGVRLNW